MAENEETSEIKEEEKEEEVKLNKNGTPKKSRVGIQWRKRYTELQKRYDQLQGKLDDETAEIEEEEEKVKTFRCPDCSDLINEEMTFCNKCGLKLTWSEE